MLAMQGTIYEAIPQASKTITKDLLKIVNKINDIEENLISVSLTQEAEFKLSDGTVRNTKVVVPIMLEAKEFKELSESQLEHEIEKAINFNFERLATMNIPNILALTNEGDNISIDTEICTDVQYKDGGYIGEGSYYAFRFRSLDDMKDALL